MATNDLDLQLRRFAEEHPQGWSHDQWLGFLAQLSRDGHDISDADGIGLSLEHERLAQTLRRMEIKGLGPKRVEALADRFGSLWNLMSASVEEVARVPSIPRSLAEQILDVLQ